MATKIAFTNRSVAALQESDPANRRPPMPSLITMLGGNIVAVCSRCQSQRNYEFAMDKQILAHEVTAWQDHRNKHHAKADWQFTTANARVKLKRLYPQFE
jgi:hypothetical protein